MPAQNGTPPNTDDQLAPSLMAAVNEAIDRLHDSLDVAESDFFCECGHVGCKERLTLSREEYASLLGRSCPLIAPAHADREDAPELELHRLRGQVHQLQGTLASRVKIEQAKGVLVERYGMKPDDAFEALRDRARHQRRSLDEVCTQIVAHAATLEAGRSFERAPRTLASQRNGGRPER